MNDLSNELTQSKRVHTRSLTDELARRRVKASAPLSTLTYQSFPLSAAEAEAQELPVWRVRLVLTSNPAEQIGLAINGEFVLGRIVPGDEAPDVFDLNPYGGSERGVSRRHAAIRPTNTNLYITDLGSTNGTQHNGRTIGVNTPYSLADGDTLALGRLRFVVYIDSRPATGDQPRERRVDLADALVEIAKAITSQLDLNEVLNQVASTARALTAAGETGIWLVDERRADAVGDGRRADPPDAPAGGCRLPMAEVLRTNRPLRVSRQRGKKSVKTVSR